MSSNALAYHSGAVSLTRYASICFDDNRYIETAPTPPSPNPTWILSRVGLYRFARISHRLSIVTVFNWWWGGVSWGSIRLASAGSLRTA